MGFSRAELEAARDRSVPDLLGDDLRLLFVGINPGLWTAAAQAHFAKRGNRFYPALHLAGLTNREIDASGGFSPEDALDLTSRGIGITNLVNRATARADELSTAEIRRGGSRWPRRSQTSGRRWSWSSESPPIGSPSTCREPRPAGSLKVSAGPNSSSPATPAGSTLTRRWRPWRPRSKMPRIGPD